MVHSSVGTMYLEKGCAAWGRCLATNTISSASSRNNNGTHCGFRVRLDNIASSLLEAHAAAAKPRSLRMVLRLCRAVALIKLHATLSRALFLEHKRHCEEGDINYFQYPEQASKVRLGYSLAVIGGKIQDKRKKFFKGCKSYKMQRSCCFFF